MTKPTVWTTVWTGSGLYSSSHISGCPLTPLMDLPENNHKVGIHLVERPSSYDPILGVKICEQISSGKTLVEICEDIEMPSIVTVWRWQDLEPSFAEMCTRARERQADVHAAEIVLLSDRCRMGQVITEKDGPLGHETRIVTQDMVERTKLQIDARKWSASRTAPHKYGDRVAHQMLDEHGKPTKAGITVIVDGAPRQLEE